MPTSNRWTALGTVFRCVLGIIACVSFAQFLLLINVESDRAQRLAGETLGRAILCGIAAAFWFYKSRHTRQVEPAWETAFSQGQSSLQIPVQPVPTEAPAAAETSSSAPQQARGEHTDAHKVSRNEVRIEDLSRDQVDRLLDIYDYTKYTPAVREGANRLSKYVDYSFQKAVQNGLIGLGGAPKTAAEPSSDDAVSASPEEIRREFAHATRQAWWVDQFDEYVKPGMLAEGWTRDNAIREWHSLRVLSIAVGAFAKYGNWSKVALLVDLDSNSIADAEQFMSLRNGTEMFRFFAQKTDRIVGKTAYVIAGTEHIPLSSADPILVSVISRLFVAICIAAKNVFQEVTIRWGDAMGQTDASSGASGPISRPIQNWTDDEKRLLKENYGRLAKAFLSSPDRAEQERAILVELKKIEAERAASLSRDGQDLKRLTFRGYAQQLSDEGRLPSFEEYTEERQRLTARWHGSKLVYGVIRGIGGDTLVFIPLQRAQELAAIYEAKGKAKTWEQFKSMIAAQDWGYVINYFEECECVPALSDSFDADSLPGFADGDWPDWPQQAMMRWLPPETVANFATMHQSPVDGPYLSIDPLRIGESVKALEAAGHRCYSDQDLVRKACGLTSSQ